MRLAGSSAACSSVAVFVVAIRGWANWSGALAAIWYALIVVAAALAVAALVAAWRSREVAVTLRLTIVGLSLPGLLAVPLLVWAVMTLAPLAN